MVESWSDLLELFPSFAVRLGISMLCGLLLGLERERKDKPAGLRTILLITVGSTLYMLVSSLIPSMMDWPSDVTRSDPSRVASQVVTGIGFLGAGTILHGRGSVHGLTTAAVIWVAAAIGLCAGVGYPLLALGVTLLVLLALVAMQPVRDALTRRAQAHDIHLVLPDDALVLQRVRFSLKGHDLQASPLEMDRSDDGIHVRFTVRAHAGAAGRLLDGLARIEGVHGPSLNLSNDRDQTASSS